jgi:hypothetical protein
MTRPTIRKGDYGSDVRLVQDCLNAEPIDGDFGPITEDAVEEFQVEHRLNVDGVVGPQTWAALDKEFSLPPYPPPMLPRLPADIKTKIENVAADSNIADFIWKDRGTAPIGYTQGMALAYATVLRKFHRGDGAVHEMARADKGHTSTDALAFYRDEFQKKGMDNSKPGINTLRHLFVILMGLGMRESSGRHCEGRDTSASNVTSNTAEAGLFQTSWNFHVCCTDTVDLLNEYYIGLGEDPVPQCALDVFKRDVVCTSSEWTSYGSGKGLDFQDLCKECPQFAVESTAVGLRFIRKHWGPINRKEVQIVSEADDLFKEIEAILAETVEVA